ncbi:MAG: class I SAM-dependent methyltransferase [Chitinophagales bacterium]|nr:class I SAM-dependent methyltransferase [Bacteroidota bacterium]MCB9044489.1 class I SAM-dependent methyltransferase [Chitinophagales bacterium]
MSSVFQNMRWKIAQSAEKIWWQRYLQNKSPEQYLAWKRNYWQENVLQKLPEVLFITSETRILDAGCGPAGIFMALPQAKVTAIDPLLESYKNLPHFIPNQYPNVHFEAQTIEGFRSEQQFDVVFCLNVINHVKNIHQSLANLAALSKKWWVMSIDAHNYSLYQKIFSLLPGDILHPHQYSLENYKNFMQQRGFTLYPPILLQKNHIFNYYLLVGERAEL